MDYVDFTVQLSPGSGSAYRVLADCPLAGDVADGSFVPPFSSEDLAPSLVRAVRGASVRNLQPEPGAPLPAKSAEQVGAALFESLFNGRVRGLFDKSIGSLRGERDRGLRLRLKLNLGEHDQARLHALPWELLYNRVTADFLGLSRLSPIVRYLEVERPSLPPPVPDTLRVLSVAPPAADLDVAAELQNLENRLGEMEGVEVRPLRPARLAQLRPALLEREYHVLHFMGHGTFDRRTGEGFLRFDGAGGRLEDVPASVVATVIKDFPSLRVAFLNACDTGRAGWSSGGNPFAGVAPALVQTGLAAVLAMQLPISDRAALVFSDAFYRRVAAGDPVDAAVSEGRQAIFADSTRSLEWAIPSLFLRVPDGALFRFEQGGREPRRQRAIEHLRAGNYDVAVRDLQELVASAPGDRSASVTLALARARGQSLRRLRHQTAQDMHRMLAAGMSDRRARGLAAAALVLLKLDYFQANAVREESPTLAEVLEVARRLGIEPGDQELLRTLEISDRTRALVHQRLGWRV